MKKVLKIFLFIVLLTGVASPGYADADFLIGIDPLSVLISPDAEGFEATDGFTTEEIVGFGSWIPSAKAGIGFDLPAAYIDLMGGVSYYLNEVFNSTNYFGDLSLLFKVDDRDIFSIGPHGSFISFNPNWDGESDIELDNTTGWAAGLKFYIGGEKVKFSASFDYLSAEFDVAAKNGWVANRDKLDISGFAAQLGVLFRF